MWRALVVFVGVLLAAGIYVLVTSPAQAAPAATPLDAHSTSFGFALAAGAIALAATFMVSRPRTRFRR